MLSMGLVRAGAMVAVAVALGWLSAVASIAEYYTYNEFSFNSVCTGLAQRQSGTRFGACVPQSQSTAQMYTLVNWTESTTSLVYNITSYNNLDCTGTGVTTQYSQQGTCSMTTSGVSNYRTYSKGVTPWIQKLAAGGIVDMYWYNQDETNPCGGPPDYYLATAYDYCNRVADGTSTMYVSCFSDYYSTNLYSDNQCETLSGTQSFDTRKCESSGVNQWHSRICGLSSSNYLSTSSSDANSDVLAGMTIGVSVIATVASGAAIAVWLFAYLFARSTTQSPSRGADTSARV